MNEPTPRAMDAVLEFIQGINVMARTNGGAYILVPIMGPDDRQVAYKISPKGEVEQRIEAAGGVPEGSTGTNTEPGEIAPPAADHITWGTYTGSVHDILDGDRG